MPVKLKPWQQVTSKPAPQAYAPLLQLRPPGAGSYVQGGNVVDVGGRLPVIGPGPTRTPVPGTPAAAPPPTPLAGPPAAAPPTAPGDSRLPWQDILDQIDARERAIYDEQARLRQQRAKDLMEAYSGFGEALQGNAAEQWAKVIQGYGRAGDTATAFDASLADSYGAGLTAANRQIASDFAAIGQEGAPAIRDDAAALEQIRTEGGARPGEMAGLVGRAWGSYGETRPGSIGFMTGQNISQVVRDTLQADEDSQVELIKSLADNPAEAMQMWQTVQQFNSAQTKAEADAAQQQFENDLALKKEQREAQAFQLQVQKYNLSYGKEIAAQAEARSRTTGTVWRYNPKTGKLENTGRATEAKRAANQRAATTQRGQDISAQAQANSLAERRAHNRVAEAQRNIQLGISQQQANTATKREAAYERGKKSAKNPQGYTPKQMQDWQNDARAKFEAVQAAVQGGKMESLGTNARYGKIPRPRDVVKAAMTAAPYSVVIQMIKNLAKTRYAGSPEWEYAAANWG